MSQVIKLIPTSGPGSGTVTSISAGTGITLTPNPIIATGTVALTVPVAIANGGTNATSMTNTFGVNYFDGTRIVTTTVGTAAQVLTSNGAGVAPTFQNVAASSITITGDTGGGLVGNSFTFTGGTTGLTFAGAGTTETLGGTLAIANGGTNATSMAVTDGTVYYDGTRLVTTATGTVGQFLRSGGAGVAPAYATLPASSISITGDTGGALTGAAFTFSGGTTGLSFGGAGTTETLTFAGITANGGTVSLATDATTSTVNVGTGAGAKTVTLGSTTSTSLLALKYGTADFTLASATGTVMSALDTGEITYPLQPAFLVGTDADIANVTGDGTSYTIVWDTEVFDANSDFASNTFTAPVTGKYRLTLATACNQTNGVWTFGATRIVTTARTYTFLVAPPVATIATTPMIIEVLADMTSGDTATGNLFWFGGAKTIDVQGNAGAGQYVNYFCGELVS